MTRKKDRGRTKGQDATEDHDATKDQDATMDQEKLLDDVVEPTKDTDHGVLGSQDAKFDVFENLRIVAVST